MRLLLILALWIPWGLRNSTAQDYGEPFRPQFHFTPAANWMNDPNGMVYYDGEWHLFYQYNPFGATWGHMSWGHAVSSDMLHWRHLPVALMEEDGVMIFSGSAVVDWKNTTGFGDGAKPPLVAIYTGHIGERSVQDQRIAYSLDRGRTWEKWEGNPVLDLGLSDFRDPKVFWHEASEQWIMVLALSVERKVAFYGSPDLKQWEFLSEFGPAGATEGVWECPDLWPLVVDNDADDVVWVLDVDLSAGTPAGGSGGQYFLGHFDGRAFTLLPDSLPPSRSAEGPLNPSLVAGFEGADYEGWSIAGDAFGLEPARGTLAGQQRVDGFLGDGLVNSFLNGDGATGVLTSPPFQIEKDYLCFLMGGGQALDDVGMELLIDGQVVFAATGRNSERLTWRSWRVGAHKGKTARVRIFDRATGGWGHINVDHIVQADAPALPAEVGALWVDYGKDYYAAVSWSDVPASDGRRLWLGWMSNWSYAQNTPTSPWRSAMSIPREVRLSRFPEGLRLIQEPVEELEGLRDRGFRLPEPSPLPEAATLLADAGLNGMQMELDLEISMQEATWVGLRVFVGEDSFTEIAYDKNRERLSVNRERSGAVDFHPTFPQTHVAPLRLDGENLRLRLFLDACSLEVFADRGQVVMTELVFPEGAGIELISDHPSARIERLHAWELDSVWP